MDARASLAPVYIEGQAPVYAPVYNRIEIYDTHWSYLSPTGVIAEVIVVEGALGFEVQRRRAKAVFQEELGDLSVECFRVVDSM